MDHPLGEVDDGVVLRTLGRSVEVRWDETAPVTAMGQMPFFAEFLRTAGLFDAWVRDCPLHYVSPNAPRKRDVLGTMVLSILAGQWRYAHISAIRFDEISRSALGMQRVMSEDSVRRAFKSQDACACEGWMQDHLRHCWEPIVGLEPWILDVDMTVKTLYGHQEGAIVSYNPHKPNRPSHIYNALVAMPWKIVLDVEVHPGDHATAAHMSPRVWQVLDSLKPEQQPWLVRGDCAWGTDAMMMAAEQRNLKYLFKIRQTANVKRLVEQLFRRGEWVEIDSNCDAAEANLQLMGWQCQRRVVVVRRRIKDNLAVRTKGRRQPQLFDVENSVCYEYSIIITNLDLSTEDVVQLYRDRATSENVFDELKNQWSWTGYVTRDLLRCSVMARSAALVYNWWTLFARLVIGGSRHREAITTRPMLLNAVGRQTSHGRKLQLTITPTNARGNQMRNLLMVVHQLLQSLLSSAEQLNSRERWQRLVRKLTELSPVPTVTNQGFAAPSSPT